MATAGRKISPFDSGLAPRFHTCQPLCSTAFSSCILFTAYNGIGTFLIPFAVNAPKREKGKLIFLVFPDSIFHWIYVMLWAVLVGILNSVRACGVEKFLVNKTKSNLFMVGLCSLIGLCWCTALVQSKPTPLLLLFFCPHPFAMELQIAGFHFFHGFLLLQRNKNCCSVVVYF